VRSLMRGFLRFSCGGEAEDIPFVGVDTSAALLWNDYTLATAGKAFRGYFFRAHLYFENQRAFFNTCTYLIYSGRG